MPRQINLKGLFPLKKGLKEVQITSEGGCLRMVFRKVPFTMVHCYSFHSLC